MKFVTVTLSALSLFSSTNAFVPASPAAFVRSSSVVSLQAEPTASTSSTRSEFLSQMVGLVVAAGTVTALPGTAQAAKYGSIGVSSPGVLDPKDAIVDDEIYQSSTVQNALKSVKEYSARVGEMRSSLEANSQIDLGPILRKEFDFSKLRSSLNELNSAYDEETQRGTDRLIRGIMQNLTELEAANAQKEGIERSERRVANINAKLDKLQNAFNDFLAFAP